MTRTDRTGILLPRKAIHMSVPPRHLTSAVALLLAVGVLAGCGSSSDSTSAKSSTTPTARPSGAPSGPTGAQAKQLAKIRECLTAAGITVDIPSGLPSRPTGTARPSGAPPSGAPGGGLGGVFSDPDAQAALKACGITLPTGLPSGPPSGQ
jgi:hypothetical protein